MSGDPQLRPSFSEVRGGAGQARLALGGLCPLPPTPPGLTASHACCCLNLLALPATTHAAPAPHALPCPPSPPPPSTQIVADLDKQYGPPNWAESAVPLLPAGASLPPPPPGRVPLALPPCPALHAAAAAPAAAGADHQHRCEYVGVTGEQAAGTAVACAVDTALQGASGNTGSGGSFAGLRPSTPTAHVGGSPGGAGGGSSRGGKGSGGGGSRSPALAQQQGGMQVQPSVHEPSSSDSSRRGSRYTSASEVVPIGAEDWGSQQLPEGEGDGGAAAAAAQQLPQLERRASPAARAGSGGSAGAASVSPFAAAAAPWSMESLGGQPQELRLAGADAQAQMSPPLPPLPHEPGGTHRTASQLLLQQQQPASPVRLEVKPSLATALRTAFAAPATDPEAPSSDGTAQQQVREQQPAAAAPPASAARPGEPAAVQAALPTSGATPTAAAARPQQLPQLGMRAGSLPPEQPPMPPPTQAPPPPPRWQTPFAAESTSPGPAAAGAGAPGHSGGGPAWRMPSWISSRRSTLTTSNASMRSLFPSFTGSSATSQPPAAMDLCGPNCIITEVSEPDHWAAADGAHPHPHAACEAAAQQLQPAWPASAPAELLLGAAAAQHAVEDSGPGSGGGRRGAGGTPFASHMGQQAALSAELQDVRQQQPQPQQQQQAQPQQQSQHPGHPGVAQVRGPVVRSHRCPWA